MLTASMGNVHGRNKKLIQNVSSFILDKITW